MGPPAGGEACGAGRLPEGTTGPRAGAVPSAKALSQEDDADREVTGLPSWEGATRKLAAELQMLRASRTQGAQPAGEDCQATTGVGPGGKAAAEKMQGADAGEVQEEKSAGEATQNVSDFSEGKEPGSPPEDSSADSRGPPVGCLTVRSISQLTEVYDVPGARPPGPVGAQRHGLANASERRPQSGCRRYFLLDDGFQCGRVLLVYPPTADKTVASQPRVFLQAPEGGDLRFVAPSFLSYYRLMNVHLGILNWYTHPHRTHKPHVTPAHPPTHAVDSRGKKEGKAHHTNVGD
eukprot:GHVT01078905.1.p1 GENE.GHVT01078905.1~~GHVT01078905.1.p1  ORF type:complete len:292 (-),score=77.40 GHVT01078905.1:175-1050(-)